MLTAGPADVESATSSIVRWRTTKYERLNWGKGFLLRAIFEVSGIAFIFGDSNPPEEAAGSHDPIDDLGSLDRD